MKTYRLFRFSLFIMVCGFLIGCNKSNDIPNVSDIPVSVKVIRFDTELFNLDTTDVGFSLSELREKYPEFSELFFNEVIGFQVNEEAQQDQSELVSGFIKDPALRKLFDTCQVVFPSNEELKKSFEQAFRFFKYYFPGQPLSEEVYTYLSEYSLGGFLYGNNSIALGLDFYLGNDYPYLQLNPGNPNFSAYLTRTFTKEHLVAKAMIMLVQDINGQPGGPRLLDYMIHRGKEMYVLKKLLPFEPDSVVMEFSQNQLDWCIENERNIWSYLISENLLYSSDFNKFRKLVEYSPNSPGMPVEAPGRTASWLGMKIVEAYMKQYPETSMEQLISLKDSQALLDASKYKPPR